MPSGRVEQLGTGREGLGSYTAVYLPALPTGRPDPSKSGFLTEEAAWEYIDTKVCKDCRGEHKKPEGFDPCYCEWIVTLGELLEEEDVAKQLDLFKAKFKPEHSKPEEKENV